MTSINDSISPDLLFNIFKRLDCIETTRIRRVCKQWFEIIDEHKSFWRILHLIEDSLKKWDPSILELFDHKSDSTLQEVDVRVAVKGELLQEQFFDLLKRSGKSLEHLFVSFPWHENSYTQRTNFLEAFPDMKSLMVPLWDQDCKVRLRRGKVIQDEPDSGSPLKVLWYGSGSRSTINWQNYFHRFQNLVSLDTGAMLSQKEWRNLLDGPSRTLKHLRVHFPRTGEQEKASIPSLDFPLLQVLEVELGYTLPEWMRFPTSITLIDRGRSFDTTLPSTSKLWVSHLDGDGIDDVQNRAPILRTLRIFDIHFEVADWRKIWEIVTKRWENVQGGLRVDGIQMEMIGTLIIPFNFEIPKLPNEVSGILEKLRELVENVVDGDSVPEFIDIEIP